MRGVVKVGLAGALLFAIGSVSASAQDYPTKPVKLLVAFAPGGPADSIARLIGQKLNERWNQSVIVENRGGAGGNIAAMQAAKADADGYTVLVTTSAFAVNQTLTKNPGYTPDDFRAAAIVATTPNLIIGAPNLKANNLKEAIELARTEKMTYGTAGAGTTPHLSAERLFKLEGKVDIPHAPFTGAGPATQAVLGSHIPLASVALSAAVQNVQSGQVKGLAVTSKERVKALPNVPTARELGLGDADDTTWVVFFVPAKTPDPVIQKINADVNAILKDSDTEAKLEAIGFMPVGGSANDAEAYVKSETARWGEIIRRVGLEPK
ncbi:Bug family tripartite tricarboxylate transporter substrate binding protein [Pseudorhodoplanes sp.]|uniref:Bug family tripartite tricarboxylate transporter substrate binding protein n=1 Tax=Pseudorhodoplanes sp. TaxID=1934341 RepID=UPI00391D7CF8